MMSPNLPPAPKPSIGVLSLDTRFPRPLGDAGNAMSYAVPARIRVIQGADTPLIVRDGGTEDSLLARFETAARELEADGVAAIVSTCGFLVTAQKRLAACVRVPVLLSALSLAPLVKATNPGRIGILTASRSALGQAALSAAGLTRGDVAIAGLEDVPEFRDTILVSKGQQPRSFDQPALERAVVSRACELVAAHSDLSAIILECGNLPPYAAAIGAATGRPVFDIIQAGNMLVRSAASALGDDHQP